LVDTAGIREADGRIERLGIEVAWRYLKGADLILLCVEGRRPLAEEELEFLRQVSPTPVVLARTKADLGPGVPPESGGEAGMDEAAEGIPAQEVTVSVVSGLGLDSLRDLLPSLVYGGLLTLDADVPVLTRERQTRAVERALKEVTKFREGLEEGLPAEVAATHLRPAETELEELLGVIPREEILDRLFREFCIGK
jgi:tRNA modification GTPase